MASPKKVDSIKLSATTLNDRDLPIAQFDRVALINWLNGLTDPNVAFFFSGEGSDTGFSNKLTIAASDESGIPRADQQMQSATLPCPPFCTR